MVLIKALCALAVIAGGIYIGLGEVRTLKYRVRLLRQLSESLSYIKSEIAFTLAPMSRIFERLAESGGRTVREFYKNCLDLLCSGRPMDESWEECLWKYFADKLRPDEIECLCEAGRVLGRSDAESQCTALDALRERIGAYVSSAENDRMRLGKLYCAMGAFVSAAIVIVLI